MTGIFICLGTFPNFALCPVKKKLFQVTSTFIGSKLKAECWHMQEQARKGARAAEGQFGIGSNKLIGMKKEKCLKLPPKLSTNCFYLDSVQVNLLPLAGSGCRVKRWAGVSVFCAERADNPQQKGCNPASLCSLLCGTSFSEACQTCSFGYGFKNVSRSLKFLVFHWLSYLTSGKKIKLCWTAKITEFLKKKMQLCESRHKVWEEKKGAN